MLLELIIITLYFHSKFDREAGKSNGDTSSVQVLEYVPPCRVSVSDPKLRQTCPAWVILWRAVEGVHMCVMIIWDKHQTILHGTFRLGKMHI